jgi:hypothetical protein
MEAKRKTIYEHKICQLEGNTEVMNGAGVSKWK